MTPPITTIGFDADDTLWHNEHFFRVTQARFAELLSDHADPDHLNERLVAAERKNLGHYGFGIKGFVLSMIETAIEVTDDRVPARVIRQILDAGQEMLQHPIDLLPAVQDTIAALAPDYTLVLITKGDLLDQERKLAQSGLGDMFDGVEIVSDKIPGIYETAFTRHGDGPAHAMMVGNSMKSDILPALQAGSWATFVPHELVWDFEKAERPDGHARFREIGDMSDLPALIREL